MLDVDHVVICAGQVSNTDLLDDIKNMLEGKLDPELKENIIGNAEVLEVFKISKTGNIAGCMVNDGTVKKGEYARLIRDGAIIYTGKIASIYREKNQVKQVDNGQECGIALKDYMDFQKNDTIEAFNVTSTERSI